MPASTLDATLAARAAAGHRTLLVVAGGREAGLDFASHALARVDPQRLLILSGHGQAGSPRLAAARPQALVGRELDAAVLDAHDGFDADVFGALAGSVRGGGLLLLCCPALAQWPDMDTPCQQRLSVYRAPPPGRRYLARLVRMLAAHDGARVVNPDHDVPPVFLPRPWPPAPEPGQAAVVEAICHVRSGQRRRPLLLLADRGRGKSAALGLAAAALLRAGSRQVVVTAHRREAVDTVFRHARQALAAEASPASDGDDALVAGEGRIEFIEPARLLVGAVEPDMLLVDEAAALPLHQLASLATRYPRLALATTVHGYEGSGRGFVTRFAEVLDQHSRGWRRAHLEQPVRHAAGDPLEALVDDVLLLDAESDRPGAGALQVECLDRDRLAADEDALRSVYALLVEAHYRTRPRDLRYLLDAPNLSVYVAREGSALVGAAWVAREGGFDDAAAEATWRGRRRPRGHLMVETLACRLGARDWPGRHGLRVVRIAVHAERRRRGIGAGLLAAIEGDAVRDGVDHVGASFGLEHGLADFWEAAGYRPLWLGSRRNATSGMRSVLVVKGLDTAADRRLAALRRRFLQGLCTRLSGDFRDECPDLAARLFAHGEGFAVDGDDLEEVARFVAGEATFEAAFPGLWRLAPWLLGTSWRQRLSGEARALLVCLLLQQRDPAVVGAGRGPALAALASSLRPLLDELLTAVSGR